MTSVNGFHRSVALTFLFLLAALVATNLARDAPPLLLVMALGAVGAVLNQHIQLSRTQQESINEHLIRTAAASPLVGMMLAVVLVLLLFSGLLAGTLFPKFVGLSEPFDSAFTLMRTVKPETNNDFYKLLAWSVAAGYSHELVTARLVAKSAG